MSPADQIKQKARELGFDLVGITTADPPPHADQYRQWLADGFHGEMGYMARRAEERADLNRVLPGVKSVIVVGMNYYSGTGVPPVLSPQMNGQDTRSTTGRIARYAAGMQDYHDVMAAMLRELAKLVDGIWYVDTGPILERDLAQRAGLGFIGKHTNLINRSFGNWIFLGAILTALQLPADPPEREYRGRCRRCIDTCPTRSIVAPYRLDARLCISYLTIELKGSIPVELRPLIGDRIFGCDDCLEVCPWNRFAKSSPVREFQQCDLPLLTEFLSWDDKEFSDRFRGTPIFRLKRARFLRNVCVALGNIGGTSARPVLERARNDPELLVREHAAWAIARIQQRSLDD